MRFFRCRDGAGELTPERVFSSKKAWPCIPIAKGEVALRRLWFAGFRRFFPGGNRAIVDCGGLDLWESDGTASGTTQLHQFSFDPLLGAALGGDLYFAVAGSNGSGTVAAGQTNEDLIAGFIGVAEYYQQHSQ